MSINILGGSYKGFSLIAPKNLNLRPTSIMLRRKLFDSNQDLTGINFFDLCAGTGAMGIEALSRGAKSVTLIEKNPKNFLALKKNIDKLLEKYGDLPIDIIKSDALSYLAKKVESDNLDIYGANSIIFFDPPYEQLDLYKKFFEMTSQVKNFQGQIWVEACRQKTFPSKVMENKLEYLYKTYTQGTSYISVFKRS
jgi:16S rRNA (guanine966-N2)-methyltransferase